MNERIEEFYSQVGLDFENFQRVTVKKGDMEKFAELIVRECVSTLGCEIVYNDNYTEKNKIISDMMELLKQHFGVKE